ncbi:MAG TPA: trypsin-like peptidase domain-containing protein, partial [Allocoleopsis sp.]
MLVLLMLISMLLPLGCSTSVSVQDQAQKVAVIIDTCGAGSGVIYYHDKNTYQVLTNRHVVAPSKSPYIKGEINQSNCIVVPFDQAIYTVEKVTFPLDNLDLAILQFSSDKQYQTVSLGDSQNVKVGDTVYIAGAPEKSPEFPQRAILVKKGEIENTTITDPKNEGYNIVYNNQTTKGMSGAPILDSGGKLIGIHGKTDVREGYKANLGIPLALFKDNITPKIPVTPKSVLKAK